MSFILMSYIYAPSLEKPFEPIETMNMKNMAKAHRWRDGRMRFCKRSRVPWQEVHRVCISSYRIPVALASIPIKCHTTFVAEIQAVSC